VRKGSPEVSGYRYTHHRCDKHGAISFEKVIPAMVYNATVKKDGDDRKQCRGDTRPFVEGQQLSGIIILCFEQPSKGDRNCCAYHPRDKQDVDRAPQFVIPSLDGDEFKEQGNDQQSDGKVNDHGMQPPEKLPKPEICNQRKI
jgi:hypothetical protein